MGEVIRKAAAAEDIYTDVTQTTLTCDARGGHWKSYSDENLVPILTIKTQVKTDADAVAVLLAIKMAALAVGDESADSLFTSTRDQIFNIVGRRMNDPYFALLYPEGVGWYIDYDIEGQPARMEVFAKLLKSGVHPRLPKDKAVELATNIEAEKDKLQALINDMVPVRSKHESLQKIYLSLARAAQMALVNAKRHWRSVGESETSVHEVIPDRSN